ncbi:hypothetical protein OQA88_4787 [Cercophora sp. LCS_1]
MTTQLLRKDTHGDRGGGSFLFGPKTAAILFQRQVVHANPHSVAIDAGSFHLTYHELDVLSSRLAWHIAAHITSRDTPIPILTATSASAVVGIVAILKAGAPYAPIGSVQCLQDHVSGILEATGGRILVYSDEFFPLTMVNSRYVVKIPVSQSGLSPPAHVERSVPQSLSTSVPGVLKLPTPLIASRQVNQDTACVIFTSGTTGRPKGVMLGHESLASYAVSRKLYFQSAIGTRALLALSISFDACNGYLFAMLCNDATVVLADPDTIRHHFSTCAFAVLTPSILKSLVPPGRGIGEAYEKLRTVVLGGETASQDLLSAWHPPSAPWTMRNEYGPTEATCSVLSGRFEYNDSLGRLENKLLGKPFAGAVVKLRDDDGNEVTEAGAEGEIFIGGPCLAHGYWRDPVRTAERFVNWRGKRFYRTGDRGRWHEVQRERIYFLGRRDRTVKNRGFLVNLETDVDQALLGSELARSSGVSGVYTVIVGGYMCMLVSPENLDVAELRNSMAQRLPRYQVPDRIATVQALPLGRTGKIDPNAVKNIFLASSEPCQAMEAGEPYEVLEAWENDLLMRISDILGLPRRVRLDEHFVNLGGNSLTAVSISSFLRSFGARIRPRDILLCGSIRELISICRQNRQENEEQTRIPTLSYDTPRTGPMTKAQSQLLYASNTTPGTGIIQAFFTFPTDHLPALKRAWKATLESESIFQMVFDLPQRTQSLDEKSVGFSWDETVLEDGADLEAASFQAQFPPEVCTSFHVFSFQGTSRLVWSVHHALVDGVSASLILRKVGAVLSGRDAMVTDIDSTIGPFICTAPLRIRLDKSSSIEKIAREIFSEVHSLALYQWLPDEDKSEVPGTAVASQQNFPKHPFENELGHVRETSAVPLTLLAENNWSFRINYRTDMYTKAQASQLAESFGSIFRSMAEPRANVAACLREAIPQVERYRLLKLGNAFSSETSVKETTTTILDVFDSTVRDYGYLPAVEKGDTVLTHTELNLASDKVARMIARHVAPGEVVGLHATRSESWIVGVFAILKAGAVYCPLDEGLPSEVRCDLFERSGATLFMTLTWDELRFAPVPAPPCLVVEDILKNPEGPDLPLFPRAPHALAYICFTSGSTGKPKGVAVKHIGVVAMQKHHASRMHAGPGRRMMQFLAVGFDGSMLELFSVLCHGATLVLRPDDDDALAALQNVDIAILTPSVVEGLDPADFPNLKYVTMGSILKSCMAGSPVTIGRPHPTVQAYTLDEQHQLVPRGVVGEIVLAGVQVAQGYVGMAQETAAKFFPDTISGWQSEKMYLTGDLGYWTEDGEIACLGREDRVVKVRGFRVSLETVEVALCALPNVRAAAAAIKQGGLLAWVIPDSLDVEAIQSELSSKLPPSDPAANIALDSSPLTRNGKLDDKSLLQTASEKRISSLTRQAGKLTRTETVVARIWQLLLDLQGAEISPSDDFVNLGGYSMKQLALAAHLSSALGFRVLVQVVLRSQTLGDLAHRLESLRGDLENTSTGIRGLGPVELSPVEFEWWLEYQSASPTAAAAFNVVFTCSLSVDVDVTKLAQA